MAQSAELVQPEAVTPVGEMTFEEFLDWTTEDTWAEWVDGRVIVKSPASNRHQDLAGFLGALLRYYCDVNQLGVIRSAPFLMRLPSRPSGREPDYLFVSKSRLDLLQENHLEGPADLVIEIISPSSQVQDRGEKFYEYEAAGIKEYWLLDTQRNQAEFYVLEGEYYRSVPVDNGIYRSHVVEGLWLKLEWLWERPLPPLPTVLKEWKLIP